MGKMLADSRSNGGDVKLPRFHGRFYAALAAKMQMPLSVNRIDSPNNSKKEGKYAIAGCLSIVK